MKRLVFDLDGTLLDIRPRHYQVYADCLRDFGVLVLDLAAEIFDVNGRGTDIDCHFSPSFVTYQEPR
jgi:beta-phosphoglucomutase-like phosphatase (HAD superfamily)